MLAGVALCGSSGSGGAAFALDEQQQQFTDMRDGLELKAQEDEVCLIVSVSVYPSSRVMIFCAIVVRVI